MLPSLPLVSVITCFYNEENFLKEAIESVLKQGYQNWEYLLVDDGSTDGSSDIANIYAEKYPGQIILLHHEGKANKGLSPSRNLGIEYSKGDLICFLDADDVYLENKLNSQVELMQQHVQADLLIEATEYWYSWQTDREMDEVIHVGAAEGLHQPPFLINELYPLGNGQSPCTSSYMLRRSSKERIGVFEESFTGDLILYEDQAFLCKYYLLGQVYISNSCNSRYRQRLNSSMQKVINEGNYTKVRRAFLRFLKEFVKQRVPDYSKLLNSIQMEIVKLDPTVIMIRKFFSKLRP